LAVRKGEPPTLPHIPKKQVVIPNGVKRNEESLWAEQILKKMCHSGWTKT